MIPDLLSNKKRELILTELYVRGRELNTSVNFSIWSYFAVQLNFRCNSTRSFIMKIPNEREIQQISFKPVSGMFLLKYKENVFIKV